jgi:GTP-binding protein Era
VRGLLTEADIQILFVDPAGLLEPAYALQRSMLHAAHREIAQADLALHLHPLADAPAPPLTDLLPPDAAPRAGALLVYTQADLVPVGRREPVTPGALVVSAKSGEGLAALLEAVRQRLPEGPFRYDAEDMSTQPVRFFVAEFIREAAFAELEQELPYSVAVLIDEFREESDPLYIRATLAVERESQKPIVLGRGGRTIKAIGTAARLRTEAFLGRRVHLLLWVRVWPKWRRSGTALARLGLPLPPERPK